MIALRALLLTLSLAAPADAGAPAEPDAGAEAVDAGAEADAGAEIDAGAEVDAGAEAVDAGTEAPDAGPLDAGVAPAPLPVPVAAPAPAEEPRLDFTSAASARFYGNLRSRLGIDTRFDSREGDPLPENVADLRSWALLGGEATFGERAKVVVEGKLRHRAVEQRPPPGQPFLLLNGEHAKATAEVMAGEAYLDLYFPMLDLRIGNQVITLGANAQGAPADVLSPLDLREGTFFNDPADVKLPVPAIRARGEAFTVGWTVVYVPFFFPDKFDLWGQDEALLQPYPGLNPTLPNLDRSVEDRQQRDLIETERPRDLPQEGDLGLRLTRRVGPVTLGADYAYTREKLPEVTVDPELARFATEGPQAAFTDPATALSLSQRYGRGEKFLRGVYDRYQVGELEGSALLGPVQLDADLGYMPERLYVDSKLNPVHHPTYMGTVTVADARGTDLTLACSAVLLYVQGIPQGEQLILVDLKGAEAASHDTYGAALIGLAGYRLMHGRLELEARGYLDARQGSRAAGGRASWRFNDHVQGTLGGEFFGGPQISPFGYWRRNDALYAELRLDL